MRLYPLILTSVVVISACNSPAADTSKAPEPSTSDKTAKSEKAIVKPTTPTPIELKIVDQPLKGKINGEDWTFVGGKAKKFGKKLKIALYDQPLDGCNEPKDPNLRSILLPDQKLTPGEGDFSFKVMAGFKYRTDKPQNDFAVKGKWRIDTVGPKKVSGAMVVDYRNHFMNGSFSVPLCD